MLLFLLDRQIEFIDQTGAMSLSVQPELSFMLMTYDLGTAHFSVLIVFE